MELRSRVRKIQIQSNSQITTNLKIVIYFCLCQFIAVKLNTKLEIIWLRLMWQCNRSAAEAAICRVIFRIFHDQSLISQLESGVIRKIDDVIQTTSIKNGVHHTVPTKINDINYVTTDFRWFGFLSWQRISMYYMPYSTIFLSVK